MTQSAAARRIGQSYSTWKRWRRLGLIPASMLRKGPGGRLMVCEADLIRWWDRYTAPPVKSHKAASLDEFMFPRRTA